MEKYSRKQEVCKVASMQSWLDWDAIMQPVAIHWVVTCMCLGHDLLRSFYIATGHILGFPDDLWNHPYITLSLTCSVWWWELTILAITSVLWYVWAGFWICQIPQRNSKWRWMQISCIWLALSFCTKTATFSSLRVVSYIALFIF